MLNLLSFNLNFQLVLIDLKQILGCCLIATHHLILKLDHLMIDVQAILKQRVTQSVNLEFSLLQLVLALIDPLTLTYSLHDPRFFLNLKQFHQYNFCDPLREFLQFRLQAQIFQNSQRLNFNVKLRVLILLKKCERMITTL